MSHGGLGDGLGLPVRSSELGSAASAGFDVREEQPMKFLRRAKPTPKQIPAVRVGPARLRTPLPLDVCALMKGGHTVSVSPAEHPEDRKARLQRELIAHICSTAAPFAFGAVLAYFAFAPTIAVEIRKTAMAGLVGLALCAAPRGKSSG